MDTRFEKIDRNLIVTLSGELDHHTAASVKDSIDTEIGRLSAKNVIFKLDGVTFMDSSGIGMIIGRYKQARAFGGDVRLTGASPGVMRLIEISGLRKIIKHYPSLDQALADND